MGGVVLWWVVFLVWRAPLRKQKEACAELVKGRVAFGLFSVSYAWSGGNKSFVPKEANANAMRRASITR